MLYFIVMYHNTYRIMQQIHDMKEALSKKCFSESKRWRWLRDFGSNRGKRWKESGMTGRDRRGTGPHTTGGLRGRLQRCLTDTQSQRYCQGPSQSSEEQSTIRAHREQTNTPVQMPEMTDRNTQTDINTHTQGEEEKEGVLWLSCESYFWIKGRWRIYLCIYLSTAGKRSLS